MKKTILVIILFGTTFLNQLWAQADSSETDRHIFWTADRQLTMSDFHNENPGEKQRSYCDTLDLCWGAATGLYAVLDVPKKKKDKKTQFEEVYFAAAFDKTMSYRFNDDTLQFQKQKLIFDLQEIAVRKARKDLKSIYDSLPAIGTKAIFFSSVKASANKYHNDLLDLFTYEVIIKRFNGAYEKWNKLIEKELIATKEFESTSKDTYRFVKGEPIKPNYEKSKKVIGNLFNEE